MAAKISGLDFREFLKWLQKRCKTVYRTANLGHRGPGIKATYKKGRLYLEWGVRGGSGSMDVDALKVIFDRHNKLKEKRTMAGQYAWGNFKECPNKIMVPFVPALIRDFEFELYVAKYIMPNREENNEYEN
mgnify:CR=1 FL=1